MNSPGGKTSNKRLIAKALVASFVIILLTWLFNLIPLKSEFTKPIKQEFEDFDIYDLQYSGEFKNNGQKDAGIVLVQAGESREEIGAQIKQIRSLHPKVLGIDLLFKRPEESNFIIEAVADDSNIVLSYKFNMDTSGGTGKMKVDSSIFSREKLLKYGGYVNFLGNQYTVIRNFAPFYKEEEADQYISFSSKIAQKYALQKYNKLASRQNENEEINYSATLERFDFFDVNRFKYYYSNGQLNDLKDKIVLLGAFDSTDKKDKSVDDLKFTPLNENMNGRGLPDNYGVVIHANIISMILEENYISKPSMFVSYIVAFCLCFLFLYYIIWCYSKYIHPKHWRFLVVQVPAILVIIWIFLLLFSHFAIKFMLVPIIVSLILCVELFWVYEILAEKLHKRVGYKTVFKNH